ncbi:ferredoxin [Candidatus Woesearchaeota archaeon]|nr:MAG: hypothetical protein QS99_C0013G0004 [archaeon GW2011_AR4]MBS3130682.1 ferredoxin [Candidatus Woesearchaeota archaeon]HIH37476.1 ferredoxin [Candidatus Woesearchaeota archaeon]HIH48924.1 ferredoxin [Candidatus Woesearchaeota archaeon]HIJ04361.1 ferredoxin [Candidatus Woesearchaeota archaeon]
MVKYKIIFNREECIGALACSAINPDIWLLAEDGKVDLKGAKKREDGRWELTVEDDNLQFNKDAADACPVDVIKIEDIEQ